MKDYVVNFSPEALEQLISLHSYLAAEAGAIVANSYVNAVINYCEKLKNYPYRGIARDDIRTGLRVTHYKGSTIIAYAVIESAVSIIGIFYGGQEYETKLD